MIIALISDIHLHNFTYGSTYIDGYNSRLLAQRDVLRQFSDSCQLNSVEKIVCLGDVFHTSKVDPAVLTVAYSAFRDLSKIADLTFIVGNHDMYSKDGTIHCLSWLNSLGHVIERPFHDLDNHLSFCPYTESKEKVDEFLGRVPKGHYVFMHQGVKGAKVGSDFVLPNEILDRNSIPGHIPCVYTGHYHRHQDLDNVIIVGSPMQHDWSDSGDTRGWIILDTETESWKFHESDAPKFVRLNLGGSDIIRKNYPPNDINYVNNNYIKVINYSGNEMKIKQELLEIGALSVEFAVESTVKENAEKLIAKDFSLVPLIEEFQKDLPSKTKEIGLKLRQGIYK